MNRAFLSRSILYLGSSHQWLIYRELTNARFLRASYGTSKRDPLLIAKIAAMRLQHQLLRCGRCQGKCRVSGRDYQDYEACQVLLF